MIKELKLAIGDKEMEGDWGEFQIEISTKEPPFLNEPFNARRFLIEHTDVAGEDIEKIDANEKWKLDKWEITEGGERVEILLDIIPPLPMNEIEKRLK